MRPFGVVLVAKCINVALLLRARALDWQNGLAFHGPMHAFMRAVLLRLAYM